MAEQKFRIESGEPTRKWRYSVGSGLTGGTGLALVLGYVIGRIDPAMPAEIRGVAAALLASLLTTALMAAVGWATRPAGQDRPVLDPGAGPPLTQEELRGALRSRRSARGR
jgi:hypothetical protein